MPMLSLVMRPMKPKLLNNAREQPARGERRRSERRSRPRRAERLRRRTDSARQEAPLSRRPAAELPARAAQPSSCDPAVEKVRRAGGPLDVAVYTCTCGYLFSAAVSTTVSCPHCGAGQAW